MKAKNIVLVILALAFLVGLTSCGVKPVLGHYVGTNPDIQFDITENGIENLSLFPKGDCYGFDIPLIMNLNGMGHFSFYARDESGVSGSISGENASGTYIFNNCEQWVGVDPVTGGRLYIQVAPEKGSWNAQRVEVPAPFTDIQLNTVLNAYGFVRMIEQEGSCEYPCRFYFNKDFQATVIYYEANSFDMKFEIPPDGDTTNGLMLFAAITGAFFGPDAGNLVLSQINTEYGGEGTIAGNRDIIVVSPKNEVLISIPWPRR